MRLEFHQGAFRDGEMVNKVAGLSSAVSLSDVRGDRDRGPLNLTREPVGLTARKMASQPIAFDRKIDRFLPNL